MFTVTQAGRGQGAILNYESESHDYSANGEDNAARRGSTIVIYATGHGELESGNDDGRIARAATRTVLPVKVRIGEKEGEVEYSGSAPGLVNGVLQVNVRVPDDAPTGANVPVVVTVGDQRSHDGVTVAIR